MLVVLCLALLSIEVFAQDCSPAGHVMVVGRVDDGVKEAFEERQSLKD